jgi:hypothetical protein
MGLLMILGLLILALSILALLILRGLCYQHSMMTQEEAGMRFIILDCYDISLTWPQVLPRV